MTSRLLKVAATLAFFVAGSTAWAQDIQERTIKFGHLNNADHPTSLGVRKFAEVVAAKSGGKLKVQEFPASTLGNELQQQSALQGGVQEMSAPATTSLAGIVTGVMLAIVRVIGETAPLLIVAGFTQSMNYNPFKDQMMTLPVFVFRQYADQGSDAFAYVDRAWTGALVLILIVMVLNIIGRNYRVHIMVS